MEKDPLLIAAQRNLEKPKDAGPSSAGRTSVHAAVLSVNPFLTYCITLITVYELYHHEPMLCFSILGVMLILSVMFILMAGKTRWVIYTGWLMILAVIIGASVGIYNHYASQIYYYAYGDMRKYTNVAGSEHASQFADAGMLEFTGDTKVDTSRAVGYKWRGNGGTVYCVAPVIDGQTGPSDPISFWAVGKNCCEERASFKCDDTGKGGAQSALLMLTPDVLVPPSLEWVISGMSDTQQYEAAVKLQQATFSTVAAANKVFLRWTGNPMALQQEFRNQTIHHLFVSAVIYLVLSIVIGIAVSRSLVGGRKAN